MNGPRMKFAIVSMLMLGLALPVWAASNPPTAEADPSGLDQLDGIEIPVMMKFKETQLEMILQALGKAAGFEVSVDEAIRAKIVSVDMEKVDMKTALLRLAEQHDLAYEVRSPKQLRVRQREQGKSSLGSSSK